MTMDEPDTAPAMVLVANCSLSDRNSRSACSIPLSDRRAASPYAAGKAAIDQLVRVAADELGEVNVRVNSVRPGLTRTPGTAGRFADADMVAAFVAGQPINRSGEVDDVAQAVRYFAGPESGWLTGQSLNVDGGHTVRAFVDFRQQLPIPELLHAPLGEPRVDMTRD
jgi:NAD(P)-dependent dehydrogenase (short-subunit alcohol dehydrogenase family)